MSGYIGNVPVPQVTQTRDTFTATSGQTSFATSGYTPGYLDVYLNGVHLVNGTDYTATNGSDVVLTVGAALNDIVQVVSFSTFTPANQTFTGDFSVDSPTFVVDSTNNRVGVNNASPAQALDVTGNIAVSGTVDGRDVAADGTKLDGIEAGAEVNPTASEILTSIKTVDGAGSGLDADLLDGQQGSYYLDGNNFINLPAGYTGWTVSDGTNSENVADSDSVIFTGSGATSVSYNTTSNTMTISSTDTNTTYSAGTGLSLVGTTFNNTAPDQTVTLTQGSNVTITGTYPNFTIASTDTNTTYSAGTGLSLSGTTFSTVQNIATTASPTFAGGTFTGNVSFGDNDKAIFGAGSDLEIFHDGNHSIIKDVGSGNLYLEGSTSVRLTNTVATPMVVGNDGGSADLYYAGNLKLATTATGVTVTGTVAATAFSGDGSALTGIQAGAGYFQGENGNTGDTTNGKGDIFRTHESTLNTNVTIASGDNSLAAGPLTVASGVTLTVSGNLSIV